MGCKRGTQTEQTQLGINLHDLDETGRLHYFYHSPSSVFPVRDVLNEQGEGYKTEPYLEKQAENYCNSCMQSNIKSFLQSRERYLFLVTKCKNKKLSRHFRKLYVVGWLIKQKYEFRPGGFYAVSGRTKLYRFDDAYELPPPPDNFRHFKRVQNHRQTMDILDYFNGKTNIFGDSLNEVRNLQRRLPLATKKKQSKECA